MCITFVSLNDNKNQSKIRFWYYNLGIYVVSKLNVGLESSFLFMKFGKPIKDKGEMKTQPRNNNYETQHYSYIRFAFVSPTQSMNKKAHKNLHICIKL